MTSVDLPTTALALSEDAADLLFRTARTANTFTDEPVSDEQLRAVHDLVQYGPTALNAQPLRVLLAPPRPGPESASAWAAATAGAPLVAVLGDDLDVHEQLPIVFAHVPGAKDTYAEEAGRHVSGRDNAWLQAGCFIVGVRAAGLAAGPMDALDAAGVDAKIFLDGRIRSLLVVHIGRPGPDARFDPNPRLPYDQVETPALGWLATRSDGGPPVSAGPRRTPAAGWSTPA